LAFSDANPAEANSTIAMTIYQGTGTGGTIVATATRTLPATLPSTSASAQFFDFDFEGVTLVVGATYSVAVTTISSKVAVIYGTNAYNNGAMFYAGTLAACSTGCDLNFRVLPATGAPFDQTRLTGTPTTINVGVGGDVEQGLALALSNAPTAVAVNVIEGDHSEEDVTVWNNVAMTMTGGSINSVQLSSTGVFDWEGRTSAGSRRDRPFGFRRDNQYHGL
jgi:hypothetical protein